MMAFMTKILNFYKKIKFRFKHLFYTLESLVVVLFVVIIIGIANSNGYQNFKERLYYEYIFYKERNEDCAVKYWAFMGDSEFSKFYWKSNTQFLKYYENKPDEFIKKIRSLKNENLMDFNSCVAIGYAIKSAHKGNAVAKDFLASIPLPLIMNWSHYGKNEKKIFTARYINQLNEKNLYNPALKNAFGNKFINDPLKSRKFYKQAADEGYFVGMENYLLSFNKKDQPNKEECKDFLKYSKILYNENSILDLVAEINANLGKLNYDQGYIIYLCNNKKTNFLKALNLMKELTKNTKTNLQAFRTINPGLIYYNGWGEIQKDTSLALNLFQENINSKENYHNEISYAYLALDSFKNNNEKKALFYLKKINDKYQVTDIITLKKFIKEWVDDWFKNPEFVKTLNIY